jgi:hypothetical protein
MTITDKKSFWKATTYNTEKKTCKNIKMDIWVTSNKTEKFTYLAQIVSIGYKIRTKV